MPRRARYSTRTLARMFPFGYRFNMNLHFAGEMKPALSTAGQGSASTSERRPDPAIWYDSANVCALAQTERHLGHAVRAGSRWIAYDATHPNAQGDGFLIVGTFENITDAKLAIESSAGQHGCWWRRDTSQQLPF